MGGIIFDLDGTVIDSSIASKQLKDEQWTEAQKLIPKFKPYSGIRELLDFLHRNNIRTAVVSTSPREYCQHVLDHFHITCGCIVGKQDGADDNKPSPEPMLKAIQHLKLKKEEVLSAGDRAKDIVSSHAAGIRAVGCLWGSQEHGKLKSASPDFLINHPSELIPIVKDLLRTENEAKEIDSVNLRE
jgi:HAD superfamily hydrolase (TIGR01549 family)